jgi:hypothetical protein
LVHAEWIKGLDLGRELTDEVVTAGIEVAFGESLAAKCFSTALWVTLWGFATDTGLEGSQAAASAGAIEYIGDADRTVAKEHPISVDAGIARPEHPDIVRRGDPANASDGCAVRSSFHRHGKCRVLRRAEVNCDAREPAGFVRGILNRQAKVNGVEERLMLQLGQKQSAPAPPGTDIVAGGIEARYIARRKDAVCAFIVVESDSELPEVVSTLVAPRYIASHRERRQQNGHQKDDYCDHQQ